MRIVIRVIAAAVIGIVLLCTGIPCRAYDDAPEDTLSRAAQSIEIPDEVQQEFDRIGIAPENPQSVLSLSPDDLLHRLLEIAAEEAAAPLKLCGMLLTMTVLSTLLGSLGDAAGGTLRRGFDTLCTLLCIGTAAQPLCDCLIRTADALDTGQAFMTGSVPVFGAFIAAGGQVAGSAAYQVFVLFLTEGIMQLMHGVLFPLLQMSAALGLADAVNPALQLGGFVRGIQKAVTWLLGFVMTMFSALLSVRGIVAAAADSLAAKSVRLVASGLIPIVGNAVSDAYGTVQGSIRLMRSGVGACGILVILWLTLPPVISLTLYRIVFRINGILAEMAGTKPLPQLYQNMQTVLSAAFAMLVCFAVMMIVSSAVMLLLLGGE
ncbi:MAG: hypothetical protein IKI45_03835 [Oscillospiraceae bacterium]|nr:hypothetical protein [Oscillospiraceae bacterium]